MNGVLRVFRATAMGLCMAASPSFAGMDSPTSEFVDNGDGTVRHLATGLTWMRCTVGQTWNGGGCTGTPRPLNIEQAAVQTASVAGRSDWRTPNTRELLSIHDFTRMNPGLNSTVFPNTPLDRFYWTQTRRSDSVEAYQVGSWTGSFGTYGEAYGYVRLVRGPSLPNATPSADFSDNLDGTVTHLPTGLTWMKCPVGQTWTGSTCGGQPTSMYFDQAAVQSASFAGKSDWRTPTVRELLTILDLTLLPFDYQNPSRARVVGLNSIFPATPAGHYWSTTRFVEPNVEAGWHVNFTDGYSNYSGGLFYSLNVRLVRGGQNERECVLSWAEHEFPSIFDRFGSVTRGDGTLLYRHYPQTNSYAGFLNGRVLVLGSAFAALGLNAANAPLDVGALSDFGARAQAANCVR